MLQQPETIDRYQVLDLIGQGSAGSVYRVLEPDHGDRFAVKLLSKTVSDIPDMQRRFVREVSILQRLQHEHVVRQIDCGLHDGQIFVVMELVDRGTLGQLLVNTPCLHWRDAVRYSQQICSALSYIHEQGVIHRDIKPANLFLSHKDIIKLGDFGIARDTNSSRLTMDGQTVGTLQYMSPEQICGEDKLTGAVDLYALGCVLYRMLTGMAPFRDESAFELIQKHLEQKPPRVWDSMSDCPVDLDYLVSWLMDKNPDNRPTSAARVSELLTDIMDGRPMSLFS